VSDEPALSQPPEMNPRVPAYGQGSLADLLPSIGAHVGVPTATDVLGLPDAPRYVVLLVDGLGWDALERYADVAGLLGSDGLRRVIDASVPSTTVTSLTSLGTGLPPGSHGMAGYSFRWRATPAAPGVALAPLKWPLGVSGLDVQPRLTYLERLANAGVGATMVAPARFADTGLTVAGLRGARLWPVADEDDTARMAELSAQAAGAGERGVVYVYHRALDRAGHHSGVGSAAWLSALAQAGELAARLRAAMPSDAVLVVTGDHGMVDVPRSRRIVAERCGGLLDGVSLLAGEARFRHVYCGDGQVQAVLARWADALGERAWVRTRQQAADEGWFGPLAPALADRFGDVVAALRDDYAVVSESYRKEWELVGMHGSLTDAEVRVPLVVM